TTVQDNPASSARARSLSWPSTTTIGSRPRAARTARRSTVSPSSSRNSLFRPIRLEVPAASSTAATSGLVMDAPALVAQVERLARGADGEHLGEDADRHLLGPLGAEVEAHRRVEVRRFGHAEILEELLLARSR